MIVDAHQHFWQLARGDYRFPAPDDPVLYRDFMPGGLAPLIAASGVSRTILVQATDTVAETAFLLEQAASTPFVAGVVGWWDPREPDCLDQLLQLPHHEQLVGVRPMLQRHDEVEWLLGPAAGVSLDRIAKLGWVFDALVDARHLQTMFRLCRRHPDLRVVLDHCAKPWRQTNALTRWRRDMERLAEAPNCHVKISGYPFAAAGAGDQFAKLVADLRTLFGDDRLLWGSDWPVAEREGGYASVLSLAMNAVPSSAHGRIFGENAAELYGIAWGSSATIR
jgi:L-fuconolactonase